MLSPFKEITRGFMVTHVHSHCSTLSAHSFSFPDQSHTNSFQLKGSREQELHDYVFSLPQENLKNNPQAVLDAIDGFAQEGHSMMTFKPNKLAIARAALEKLNPPPKVLIELGAFVGMSSVAWGAMLKDLNGGKTDGVHVYCLELEPKYVAIAGDMVKLAGVDDVVTIVQGKSGDSLKKLKADGTIDKIDVLFIDHWEEYYLPDLQLVEELDLFHEGSTVIADNTDVPGAPDYLKYVQAGGSGKDGAVKYKTETFLTKDEAEGSRLPNMSGREKTKAVEISTVLSVPN
jgi:catechol O-methyltransferase